MATSSRWPAEWEPQDAVWLSWPVNEESWVDNRAAVEATFVEFAAAITRFEPLRMHVPGEDHGRVRQLLEAGGVDPSVTELIDYRTDDSWCRDHGPVFVEDRTAGGAAIVDFTYNAWGGKFPPWDRDDAVPGAVAGRLNLPHRRSSLVCEGGAIEGNGAGLLLTTESVLLNPNRNPGRTREEIEAEFRGLLGVESVFWLPAGLVGDDTDGHIDTLTRFVAEDVVVTVVEGDPRRPNAAVLERNRALLENLRTVDGRRVAAITLPLPDPVPGPAGWREAWLPVTYANFLIINGAVIVPTYGQRANDDRAREILGDCFPGRKVLGIDSREVILEGGALHCLSMQQPRVAG